MTEPERVTRQTRHVDALDETTAPGIRLPASHEAILRLQRMAGNRAVAARLTVQRSSAEDLIDKHTSWNNLDEEELGSVLLKRALQGEIKLVDETLSELDDSDRDDVSLAFTEAATDKQLTDIAASSMGRRLLDRMLDELTEGSAADDEQAQADRILRIKAQFIDPATAEKQMLGGKVFPFRQSGITVLDDAPIMAERRENGQIWVKQPTRVRGTSMFKAETATLPQKVFIEGMLLPENEMVGVKFYDLGGEVVYRPALFLVQVSNQNDTATLTKIAEVAGIALTLGTGALASLGVEASMAARVLLWADRAAFALGAITTVINEHRGEIIELFGDSGREFLRYVDVVHSATVLYGFARLAIGMVQVVNGFRKAYVNWRSVARSMESELDGDERQMVQVLTQQTDEVLQDADNVAGSTQKPPPVSEPQTAPPAEQTPAGPSTTTQPSPGQQGSFKDRFETSRAAKARQEAAEKAHLQKEIDRIDREWAAGKHKRQKQISQEDMDWLNSDPRRKELAYDSAIGSYRVTELRSAAKAEETGVLPGPVTRSNKGGEDLMDGAGVGWSLKGTGKGSNVDNTADKIVGVVTKGNVRCLADLSGMSAAEQAAVRLRVSGQLMGQKHAEVRFLPPDLKPIPAE